MRRKTSEGGSWGLKCFFAVVLSACASVPGAAETADESARAILDATGVRGGLVVHLGCGDGRLTAALRAGESYLVQGLDTRAANVEDAREYLRSKGLYGKVSVDRHVGGRLPYVDNLVNLVVAEQPGSVSGEEILRVLAPGGVAYVNRDGRWTKTVKLRPTPLDQWTHFLHDADNNAVAQDDVVGPPRHVQWKAEPLWTRNHHTLASISAVISTGQRVFYLVDQAPAGSMELPGRWSVVARDAFSGVLLWTRPLESWAWHGQKFRSGPVQLPRTLVAGGGRVYVPLGLSAALSALDAASGEVLKTYPQTDGTEEVILHEGVLLVVTGSPTAEQAAIGPQRSPDARFPNQKSVVAIDAASGKPLWTWPESGSADLVPLTLAAAGSRVLLAVGSGVVCLDRGSGKEIWRQAVAETDRPGREIGRQPGAGQKRKPQPQRSAGWSVATLVVRDDVVLWANGGQLAALAAESGEALWQCPSKAGFRSPADVLVAGGLVWLGPDFSAGRDLHSGEVRRTSTAVRDVWTVGHHHRCYREKATERYVLTGYRGIEFLDLGGEDHTRNNWVRGVCQIGIIPCNGLIYAPAHTCGCFMEAKLYGFWALAPQRKAESRKQKAEEPPQLERGPAYSQIPNPQSEIPNPDDWPMHRHDPLRSGSTPVELPARLQDVWHVDLGGRLSPPVVAEGYVLLASIDQHRAVALDARDGKTRWSFTAGGRVDSPPTVYRGLVLFGSADGWVYCLRLSDGQLAWRFRAAPEELRTVALDQVESVWPVPGSVLVQNGVAYAAAGRSSYLDGGIVLCGLEPTTGKVVCRERVSNDHPTVGDAPAGNDAAAFVKKIGQNATDYKTFKDPDLSDGFSMDGATNDVLVGDGQSVYLRHLRFDRNGVRQRQPSRHLFSTTSLLDDSEVHRTHFVLGTGDFSRIPVAYSWIVYNPSRFGSSLVVPYGMMLAFDEGTVWGVRRPKAGSYLLFAEKNRPFSADEPPLPDFRKTDAKKLPDFRWGVELTMRPRAMLRAGGSLVLGGMPLGTNPKDLLATYEGRTGGLFWTVSATDGSKTAEYSLPAPPVWDGMAAAGGRLYVSTSDGRLSCIGEKR